MSEASVITNRKYYKRNKILNIIRSGKDLSRHDVQKATLYSVSTVRDVIGELIEGQLVYEVECQEPRVGRKPIWLKLNPDGAYFIGVEFNANRLHCALMNLVGDIIWKSEEKISRADNRDQILHKITSHITTAIENAPAGAQRVMGVCVGIPGYLDKENGIAISYYHLKEWENVPIRQIIQDKFGLPCYLNNNVNVMAFAYKWLYYNGEAQDFIFVSMRTGVRMVPVMNNQMIISETGFSGELGHVQVPGSGRICTCGRFGCLNSEISNVSIIAIIKEGLGVGRFQSLLEMAKGNPDAITIDLFCKSVQAGHSDSLALMRRTAQILGNALSAAANIFAPVSIVLSGEILQTGQVFIDEVYNAMKDHVVEQNFAQLKISASAFDSYIGATGAAAFVMQEEFEFIDKQI